ncbi:lysoplasmalogenase [Oceanobacillus kimchii]|uniref:lysoplasmalogenase n=1 Tax=Oceanobacillus TaxID=182709 RepID=UPI0003463313|nr:lysoplasmalogenase [Oceanobacillus kimchii]MCT1576796.1 lysoplasmalogenase [Oceanobacillus kimchii]MCT2134866.1 lysoplasmalogenase [Oceanobacillus kimchii]
MVLYRLPILILTTSIVYIFISPSEPFVFSLFFKVIPMILIIIYATEQMPPEKNATHWFILIGLCFCIIGDATLHWFIIGLTAFLLGHVSYTLGFIKQRNYSLKKGIAIIPITAFAIWMGIQLLTSLQESGQQHLIIPVIAYITIISTMAFTAILTGNRWAIIGSILFLISDSILSWNMFISSFSIAGDLVMLTYYSAQFLIAHSLFTIVPGTGNTKPIIW